MNPIAYVATLLKMVKHVRQCPKCRHMQYVESDKKQRSVVCKKCGGKIPPIK